MGAVSTQCPRPLMLTEKLTPLKKHSASRAETLQCPGRTWLLRRSALSSSAGSRFNRCTKGESCTRTIGAGEVLLVEDTFGKGHVSKAVNGRTRHSVFIPLD